MKQKNDDLRDAHSKIIKANHGMRIPLNTLLAVLAEQPAPRFYISPFTAWLYLTKHRNPKNKLTQEMIEDLQENLARLKRENPDASNIWLYEKVVKQPAKSFYMSPHRIKEIIFHYTGRTSK